MLIWPILVKFRRNIPRIMKNKNVSGDFYFQNIFPVVSNYASHLACFKLLQLQMWISRQPIKISEKPDTLKGEVWSRKILSLLIELFHRNSRIIAVLSSLLCNYDNSALKLLLSTTFATRKNAILDMTSAMTYQQSNLVVYHFDLVDLIDLSDGFFWWEFNYGQLSCS